MKGYWNMPEATAEDAIRPGGWFRTGDAGYRDDDGYIYLYDRMKDMIVSGGRERVPGRGRERRSCPIPAWPTWPSSASPTRSGARRRRPWWCGRPSGEVTEAELIELLPRSAWPGFKCPTSVDWIDALPRNPSGKVLKKDLRAPYWAGHERFVG